MNGIEGLKIIRSDLFSENIYPTSVLTISVCIKKKITMNYNIQVL